MNNNQAPHISVLLNEVISYLNIKSSGRYLDCTFGAGGYSRAILQTAECELYALDQDPEVAPFVEQVQTPFGPRFNFQYGNFSDAADIFSGQKFDGIVLDIGVSSMQLDKAHRGFSFMLDGPLDMRMSQAGISATEIVNNYPEEQLANLIYKYGDEVQSRAIAKNIVKYRQQNIINTTGQLATIIRESMHYRPGKIDPATKTFQAIRIFVNKELEMLEQFLSKIENMLAPNGRIIVVSFHALEDRIVKHFFLENAIPKTSKSKYAPTVIDKTLLGDKWLKIINKKAIMPSRQEVVSNPRSRSAKMRVAEKIQEVL